MNSYYLTLILKPDITENDRQQLLLSVTKNFAKKVKEDLWGERNLAYPIKKWQKGWYAHFEFESEPKVIPNLDKQLKLAEDVLRYLIIRK